MYIYTNKQKQSIMKNYIENLEQEQIRIIWNLYIEAMNVSAEDIHFNDSEFLAIHFSTDLMALANAISRGEYKAQDTYVCVDTLGNLYSGNSIQEILSVNEINEMIDWVKSEEWSERDVDLIIGL